MDTITGCKDTSSGTKPKIVPREGVLIKDIRSNIKEPREAVLDIIKPKECKDRRRITIYEKPLIANKIKENKNVDVIKNSKDNGKSVLIKIPYKKIDMIRILQDRYEYEIKGTFYFDEDLKFQSFEIRTNLDPKSADGDAEWALFFHTHPKKTAETLGLPYFSPPSVEDVMEIYERTLKDFDTRKRRRRLGETSIIFTSEGVWIIQVDHKAFLAMVRRTFGGKMPDEEILELILNETYNGFLVETLREINPGNNNLLNGLRAPDRTLEVLARIVSEQYGFNLRFISWPTLEQRKELSFTTQLEHLEIN